MLYTMSKLSLILSFGVCNAKMSVIFLAKYNTPILVGGRFTSYHKILETSFCHLT